MTIQEEPKDSRGSMKVQKGNNKIKEGTRSFLKVTSRFKKIQVILRSFMKVGDGLRRIKNVWSFSIPKGSMR